MVKNPPGQRRPRHARADMWRSALWQWALIAGLITVLLLATSSSAPAWGAAR